MMQYSTGNLFSRALPTFISDAAKARPGAYRKGIS